MDTIVNFAYGSNMLHRRLAARVPSARPLGQAVLHGHVLRWHKVGQDGSGKCDVARAARGGGVVHGVLYEIAAHEVAMLHRAEGLGAGYELSEQQVLAVGVAGGRQVRAQFYRATHIDPGLRPFDWYKALVLAGALEHGLPAAHVDAIAAVEAVADGDDMRSRAHFDLVGAA